MFIRRQTIVLLFAMLFPIAILTSSHTEIINAHPNQMITPASIQKQLDSIATTPNTLTYSTFLGGSMADQINDMAKGSDGSIYLIGNTESSENWAIPSTTHIGPAGGKEIFVLKLDATGTNVLYATLIGGSSIDSGLAIAVDDANVVYITGTTASRDFPVTSGAYDTTCNTSICYDVIVAKLNAVGDALILATYMGGAGYDTGHDIAVDTTGNIYISGRSDYGDFPTTSNAFDTTYGGGHSIHNMGDGFVAKLPSDGSHLIYSTYLGGEQADSPSAMVVDANGSVIVTGYTKSEGFPSTPGAYDTSCGTDGECDETSSNLGYGGPSDIFVTKIAPSGGYLLYSTFVGSSGVEGGNSIVLNDDGSVYVVGNTGSTSFPTTINAVDRYYNGDTDSFLLKLNNTGSSLEYSTFLGGQGYDQATAVSVLENGDVFVSGNTTSPDFPITSNSYDSFHNGEDDAFLAVVDLQSTDLSYATFLGGAQDDVPYALLLTDNGDALLAGSTRSADFPTTDNAHDAQCGADGLCDNVSYPKTDGFLTFLGRGLTISGRITDRNGNPVPNVTVWAGFPTNTQTNADGYYIFEGLQSGNYTLTPDGGYFLPPSRKIILPPDASDQDFLYASETDCELTTDTDGDALLDGWEFCGYDHDGGGIDINLPAMGAHPWHADIFVEIDYMAAGPGETETHQPNQAAIDMIVESFNKAPVNNPDGTTGIHLHVDNGPDSPLTWGAAESWGSLSDTDEIPHKRFLNTILCVPFNWSTVEGFKDDHFDASRRPIFHYSLWAHALCEINEQQYSGISRNNVINIDAGASDFIVSLGELVTNPGTVEQQAGTFMHELGHNLGLAHGGSDNFNYKPNYLSVMNYSFQFGGLHSLNPLPIFDYSRQDLPTLNELNLDETASLGLSQEVAQYYKHIGTVWYCDDFPNGSGTFDLSGIDWDCDRDKSDTSMLQDINKDNLTLLLSGHNDWENIVFSGGAVGGLGEGETLPLETDLEELTEEEANQIPRINRVFLPIAMK